MSAGVGFRVITSVKRPERELVEKFAGLPTSNINDEMNRLYCMRSYMKPLNHHPLIGTAITVKAPLGDNLVFHHALDIAKPGDVVVVDGGGCCERSLAGEMMVLYAEKRGLAGIVVDGAMRDLDGIQNVSIPVYAKAIAPQGPYKNGPGEINVPISCGGQVVFPGDILVGDQDGIVVIRPEYAGEILGRAQAKREKEALKLGRFAKEGADEEAHRSWVEKSVMQKGILYIGS